VSQLFGNNRRVAIGFNGIAFFLSNDDVDHAMKVLYDWTDTGSRIFLCDAGFEGTSVSPALQETFNIYEKLGQPMTFRSLDTLRQLIPPWKVREPGFLPLEEWIGMKAVVAEETQKAGELVYHGAILEK
ncbi:MAG: SAM-dependent methyltransferase, partial [Spirochaetia bacterium]